MIEIRSSDVLYPQSVATMDKTIEFCTRRGILYLAFNDVILDLYDIGGAVYHNWLKIFDFSIWECGKGWHSNYEPVYDGAMPRIYGNHSLITLERYLFSDFWPEYFCDAWGGAKCLDGIKPPSERNKAEYCIKTDEWRRRVFSPF